MRILVVAPAFRPAAFTGAVGGGEISNRLLLEGLAARGHAVTVATIAGGGERRIEANGVTIVEARERRLSGRLATLLGRLRYRTIARRVAHEAQPDIILAATSGLPIALNSATAHGVPIGVFVRAFEHFPRETDRRPKPGQTLKHLIRRVILGDASEQALRQADFLLPNSAFMRTVCIAAAPAVPAHVIYPPLDLVVRPMRSREVIRVVSMVGTSEKKGVGTVMALAARFPDLHFRVVGVPDASKRPAQTGNLAYVGWSDTAKEFGDRADIVLVPSSWEEPFGRVAIEGLAAGAIVLASDIGGLPEALSHERALLVQAGDIDAWQARLHDVMTDPAPYRRACERARAGIERFTLDEQVSALQQALDVEVKRFARHA